MSKAASGDEDGPAHVYEVCAVAPPEPATMQDLASWTLGAARALYRTLARFWPATFTCTCSC